MAADSDVGARQPAVVTTMKWTTAGTVLLLLVTPVPLVAGVAAWGLVLLHALPWALRQAP